MIPNVKRTTQLPCFNALHAWLLQKRVIILDPKYWECTCPKHAAVYVFQLVLCSSVCSVYVFQLVPVSFALQLRH